MSNHSLLKEIKKEVSLINGLKSLKLSESIKKNPSLVDIIISKIALSIGMLTLKPIKKRPIINSVLQGRPKHMI